MRLKARQDESEEDAVLGWGGVNGGLLNGGLLIARTFGLPSMRPTTFHLQLPTIPVASLRLLLLFGILSGGIQSPYPVLAQVEEDAPLYREISVMDSLLFVEGFNRCNLSVLRSIVAEGLDFYHDQSGIQDKPQFMMATEQNICSSPDRKPIRKLLPGSVEVFPLHRDGTLYGAIQSGRHEFYIQEPGTAPYKTSVARFVHVWIRDGKEWRLAEVLSYDHQDPPE